MRSEQRRISRILVANRGEIARRVFRTCRLLGIQTVAVFSDVDRAARFVQEADQAVALGGKTALDSYLRAEAIIDAAAKSGADAVHPGYGFLAENPSFAEAVIDAGLVWIGPHPDSMAAVGSKLRARELMASAGVPILPGEPLSANADLVSAAKRVGLPALVKASAGGGGKGMRTIRDLGEAGRVVDAARREALSAFGDDAVFLERHIERPRHVEVQIFGDAHGGIASLFERDCSTQRRYQKVIEEAPSPAVDENLRHRLSETAVAAARAVDYVGAGTVEFIVTPEGEFFFLEINARLQVEHPVTEAVTGLDLVALQISVAEGMPLPTAVGAVRIEGHAIEARLYAEDPGNGFLPVTGEVERLCFPETVRVEAGIGGGEHVTAYYDPLLAKIIAHAPTRAEAARLLADALRRAEIHGIHTNRDFLVRTLRHPRFVQGDMHTAFVESVEAEELRSPLLTPSEESVLAAAAALHGQEERRRAATVLGSLPSGWRNNPSQPQVVTYRGKENLTDVAYEFDRNGEVASLVINGTKVGAPAVTSWGERELELEMWGVRQRYRVRRGRRQVYVNTALHQADLLELPRFASEETVDRNDSLVAPMPGAVIRVEVEEGTLVERGQPLLVIEAMKMEHEIVAPAKATVRDLLVACGDQVDAGQPLAVLEDEALEAIGDERNGD